MTLIHQIIKDLLRNVKDPIFAEVGCHNASDSEEILRENPHISKYYAFEPDKRHYETIMNRNLDNKFNLYNFALSDKIGNSKFHLSEDPEDFNGSSSLLEPTGHLECFTHVTFPKVIEVETITLDHFAAYDNISRIDYIFTDLQGSEWNFIQGGQETLRKTHYLQLEFYDREMFQGQKSLDECISALPGSWKILYKLANDCILENLDFKQN